MRKLLLFCLLAQLFIETKSQIEREPDTVTRKFFGLTPPKKHSIISGIAFGFTAYPWKDSPYVKVNGINIELGPMGIIGGSFGLLYGLAGQKDSLGRRNSFFSAYGYEDDPLINNVKHGTWLNGISISLGGIYETTNRGLIINGLSCLSYSTKGVQISGILNVQYEFQGIMIAGIANKTTKGKGLQIGIINNCESGQVVQIGLFNRIGKRVLPIINFNFKKKEKFKSKK